VVLGEVAAWRAACTTTERFWINLSCSWVLVLGQRSGV
jgi:hypothetical protein